MTTYNEFTYNEFTYNEFTYNEFTYNEFTSYIVNICDKFFINCYKQNHISKVS